MEEITTRSRPCLPSRYPSPFPADSLPRHPQSLNVHSPRLATHSPHSVLVEVTRPSKLVLLRHVTGSSSPRAVQISQVIPPPSTDAPPSADMIIFRLPKPTTAGHRKVTSATTLGSIWRDSSHLSRMGRWPSRMGMDLLHRHLFCRRLREVSLRDARLVGVLVVLLIDCVCVCARCYIPPV